MRLARTIRAMRLPGLLLSLALTSTTLVACGHVEPKTAKVQSSRLGHFSTVDGTIHLVLDRTGARAKMQVEGTTEVVELAQEEVRSRVKNRLMGYDFFAKDGQRVLFIDVYGAITFIRGRDELMVSCDGSAKPLGEPTVLGTVPVGSIASAPAAPAHNLASP